MDQLKLIAKAHYKAGSKKTQDIAREFFDAMDKDNSRKVDYVEFKEFMRSKGHSYYVDKNLFNNLGRHGLLDFWDVMTLYYIIKSRRPFCSKCDELVASVYFACVKCFERSRRPYCICLPCYGHADYDFKHRGCDHPSFLDSYTLLEAQRLSAYKQQRGSSSQSTAVKNSYRPSQSSSSTNIVQPRDSPVSSAMVVYPHRTSSSQSSSSTAIVPSRSGNRTDNDSTRRRPSRRESRTKNDKLRTAYEALEVALKVSSAIGSVGVGMAACAIL